MTLASQYAQALFEKRESDTPHAVLKNFNAGLTRRGHHKLLPRIFAEYQKLEARASRRRPKISLAHENEKKAALAKAREFLPDGIEVEVCNDPSLSSGFVIQGKDFRYDVSARRSLLDLYTRLTAGK